MYKNLEIAHMKSSCVRAFELATITFDLPYCLYFSATYEKFVYLD